ncbi:MAG TPA: Uma2 family endonuclease, partial [Planctomycetota bacterium]|nr:Uma2 family endonuclease [Planctomycetota bacterium]
RGEFAVSPSPGSRHQRIVRKLAAAFESYVKRTGAGEYLFSPMDVILSEEVVVQPDLLFVAKSRRRIIGDRVRGAPDVVIEVLSPETADRDRFVKRDLYERFGVSEYWILNPDARTAEIFTLQDSAYGAAQVFEAGDRVSTRALPGFELDLSRIWE